MDIITIGYKLLLALLIGSAIGFEREMNERTNEPKSGSTAILGIRTFSLVTMLGGIMGLVYHFFLPVALLISGAFFILLTVFYVLDVFNTKDTGITTEIALMYSFIIGMLLTLNIIPIQITLAVAVALIFLLSQKEFIKKTVRTVERHELNAFISFMIIALVVLPFLPNTSYSAKAVPGVVIFLKDIGFDNKIFSIELINPFKIWLYVALITGIDFAGYFLERITGNKKGWLLTSMAGGFVSSTATTQSLAQESRSTKGISHLLSAAILSNIVSFVQIAILIASLNALFFVRLLPVLGFMIGGGLLSLIYFMRVHVENGKSKKNGNKKIEKTTKIIDLKSALTFAGLFIIISLFSKIALLFFGQGGFLLATGFGAFVGIDAVMINTSQLVGKDIGISLALLAFIIANAVNLFAKVGYSYAVGAKKFAFHLGISFAVIIAASLVGYFIAL